MHHKFVTLVNAEKLWKHVSNNMQTMVNGNKYVIYLNYHSTDVLTYDEQSIIK